ncbi:MAG TPA: GntR family transcriptional regulator [Rhodopila sp.]|nr:GntR family transcriptional regulator [Rhodopila sp.]
MLLRDYVYRAIRQSILNCDLQPGQEVREQTLAQKHRVSRSPVRDALLRLEQEHLVTVLPRQGYLINPVTIPDTDDLYGLRLLLEPACAAAAALRDEDAVRTLDRFRRTTGLADRYETYADYNSDFHNALAELSGNARTAAIMRDALEQLTRLQRLSPDRFDWLRVQPFVEMHDAIIDAVQAHDPEAAFGRAASHVKAGATAMLEDMAASKAAWRIAGRADARPMATGPNGAGPDGAGSGTTGLVATGSVARGPDGTGSDAADTIALWQTGALTKAGSGSLTC